LRRIRPGKVRGQNLVDEGNGRKHKGRVRNGEGSERLRMGKKVKRR